MAVESKDAGKVVLRTEPATLMDVFEELDVQAEGPPVVYEAYLDSNGVTVVRTTRDFSRTLPEEPSAPVEQGQGYLRAPLSVKGFQCEGAVDLAAVEINGSKVEESIQLVPVVNIKITKGWISSSVDLFEFFMKGNASIKVSIAEVGVAGGVTGKLECKQALPGIPFAFIPLVGPVGIAPVVKPEFGAEVKVGYTAGEIKFGGPTLDKGVEVKLGFGYSAANGFYTISERVDTGEGATLGQADASMKNEFKVQFEPFFQGVLAGAITLAHWEIFAAETVRLKFFGGADLAMTPPFGESEQDYKGPEWNICAGVLADLAPLMDSKKYVDKLFEALGLPKLGSLDVVLFSFKRVLFASPKPKLTVTPKKVTLDEPMFLQADALNAAGMKAKFVAFHQPEEGEVQRPLKTLAEVTMGGDGLAKAEWRPGAGDDGKYKVNLRIYDSIFGAIGLPYAIPEPSQMPEVVVVADTSLTIDPPRIEEGELNKKYQFTLASKRIPTGVSSVRFEWDFGDGTTGSQEVDATATQEAQTTIEHAYEQPGTYVLQAYLVNPVTGKQLADERATVSVGSFLTIVPSFFKGELDTEYAFTFEAKGLPQGEVTFEWNFGDGAQDSAGSATATTNNGRASVTVYHRFGQEGSFGVYGLVKAGGQKLADATAMVVIREVPQNQYDMTICNTWQVGGSGGEAGTIDTWSIAEIPPGALFDLYFDAYSIPDMFFVEYPEGILLVSTGWRGDFSYNDNPRYPGGIAGPGQGEVSGMFKKGKNDYFVVSVIGGEPGTEWTYQVRCRTQ